MSLRFNNEPDIGRFFALFAWLFFNQSTPAIAWQAMLKLFGLV